MRFLVLDFHQRPGKLCVLVSKATEERFPPQAASVDVGCSKPMVGSAHRLLSPSWSVGTQFGADPSAFSSGVILFSTACLARRALGLDLLGVLRTRRLLAEDRWYFKPSLLIQRLLGAAGRGILPWIEERCLPPSCWTDCQDQHEDEFVCSSWGCAVQVSSGTCFLWLCPHCAKAL